jgi:outer membrane receptor protein involved in Fe transport
VPGAESVVSYANAEAADNLGFEVEARKSFDFIDESLADLSLAVNATFVYSNVRVPEGGVQTSAERPLQGQSPWVVNAQLGWDDPDHGTAVTLLYNAFGPRIAEVGGIGAPDVCEETVHSLDLVARQALGAGFVLGASARNLIDPEVRLTQGDETTSILRKGRTFSISLGYSFQ